MSTGSKSTSAPSRRSWTTASWSYFMPQEQVFALRHHSSYFFL
jgi:hypothetical protein